MKIYRVPGTKILWKNCDEHGPMVSQDNATSWHFTFRGLEEFREMHPTLELITGEKEPVDTESSDREVFGEL